MSISAQGLSGPVLSLLSFIQLASTSGTSASVTIPHAMVDAVRVNDESLEETVLHTHIAQYILAAGVAIWAYDYTLTIDDEVSLLWKKGVRKHVKTLYFLNRYLPIIGLAIGVFQGNPLRTAPPSILACKGTWVAELLLQAIEVMVAPTIFVIRIYTIYYQNKFMQTLLVGVLCLSNISLIVCLVIVYRGMIPSMESLPILNICVSLGIPSALGGLYVTPIVVETLIFGATLWHALTFTRNKESFKGSPTAMVLNALYIDGVLYFLILVSVRMTTTCVYYLAPQSLNYLTVYFEYALTSALTSRWFLSLRRTVKEGNSNPNTVASPTHAQRLSKSRRNSAIERGPMSFGLRSNNGKDTVRGLSGLNGFNQKSSVSGIKVETETYMMSDLAADEDNGVPVKSAPIWFDS